MKLRHIVTSALVVAGAIVSSTSGASAATDVPYYFAGNTVRAGVCNETAYVAVTGSSATAWRVKGSCTSRLRINVTVWGGPTDSSKQYSGNFYTTSTNTLGSLPNLHVYSNTRLAVTFSDYGTRSVAYAYVR